MIPSSQRRVKYSYVKTNAVTGVRLELKTRLQTSVQWLVIYSEHVFSRNRNRKSYIFISKTITESEPKIFLGKKPNWIRKASISWNGTGNRIVIQRYLKRVFATRSQIFLTKERTHLVFFGLRQPICQQRTSARASTSA